MWRSPTEYDLGESQIGSEENAMNQFTAKYADSIGGVLSGFDRVVLRGTIRALVYVEGMKAYLSRRRVLLKDFGDHAERVTKRIKETSLAPVLAMGRRVQYVASPKADKEAIARQIAREDGITEGPICVLTCVEPSYSYEIYRNRDAKRLQIVRKYRPCLHLYHYAIHPVFGFMNARIQTWFPFNIQMCLNGREWLSRQMDAEGMQYVRQGNCFVCVEDFARAQAMLDAQLDVSWPTLLDEIAHVLNPAHGELFGDLGAGYYWSTHQSEWATDVSFRQPQQLRRLHPMLVRHGMTTLGSTDVLRFLGHKIAPDGPTGGLSRRGHQRHQDAARRRADQAPSEAELGQDVRQSLHVRGCRAARRRDDHQQRRRLQGLPPQGGRSPRTVGVASDAQGHRRSASAGAGQPGRQ
jgi:hypothetical protein